MTDDQIHKEVLKVMGWTCHPDRFYCDKIHWRHPKQPGNWGTCDLPPLTLDLMWQEVNSLTKDEKKEWVDALYDILRCDEHDRDLLLAQAGIEERARAFLVAKSTPSP